MRDTCHVLNVLNKTRKEVKRRRMYRVCWFHHQFTAFYSLSSWQRKCWSLPPPHGTPKELQCGSSFGGCWANQEYWLIFPIHGASILLLAWQPYSILFFLLIFLGSTNWQRLWSGPDTHSRWLFYRGWTQVFQKILLIFRILFTFLCFPPNFKYFVLYRKNKIQRGEWMESAVFVSFFSG